MKEVGKKNENESHRITIISSLIMKDGVTLEEEEMILSALDNDPYTNGKQDSRNIIQ